MRKRVNFALAIHDHQPIGNFDDVFHMACNMSYVPFLEMLREYPAIRLSMHVSGCLLEWLEEQRSEVVETLKDLVASGQIELLGGGYYEPILTMLPERDRLGQVKLFSEHLEESFGQSIRGAWVAERVWEQYLTSSYAKAGIDYVILDDYHFKNAGLSQKDLDGYYVTEDEGNLLKVFASDERLRYAIPFKDPEKTIEILEEAADDSGTALLVYGDDGEKFGVWPETHKHVFEKGWLRRFFDLLTENRDWIRFVTLSEAADELPPRGKVYLPDASYREMTEWALPARRLVEYEELHESIEQQPWGDKALEFIRGGTWRNFKAKYPEANYLYAKMMHVSQRLNSTTKGSDSWKEARKNLYRGQCNCPYWHGVFGGLYMPHLRRTVYSRLVEADAFAFQRKRRGAAHEVRDFDMDGHEEVFVENSALGIYLKPGSGGRIYELDFRPRSVNLANCITRRYEAYHEKLPRAVVVKPDEDTKTIHEIVRAKEPGLMEKLFYDTYQRDSFIERFFSEDETVDSAAANKAVDLGDFVNRSFAPGVEHKGRSLVVNLEADGQVAAANSPQPVHVHKQLALKPGHGAVRFDYRITNNGQAELNCRLATEFNLTLSAGDAWGRYCYVDAFNPLGHLAIQGSFPQAPRFGMVDEWLGVRLEFVPSQPVDVWMYPIKTVSQSEGGFELVYQSSVVNLIWPLRLGAGQTAAFEFALRVEEHRS